MGELSVRVNELNRTSQKRVCEATELRAQGISELGSAELSAS